MHMNTTFFIIDEWSIYQINECNYRNTPLANTSINVIGYVMYKFGLLDR